MTARPALQEDFLGEAPPEDVGDVTVLENRPPIDVAVASACVPSDRSLWPPPVLGGFLPEEARRL